MHQEDTEISNLTNHSKSKIRCQTHHLHVINNQGQNAIQQSHLQHVSNSYKSGRINVPSDHRKNPLSNFDNSNIHHLPQCFVKNNERHYGQNPRSSLSPTQLSSACSLSNTTSGVYSENSSIAGSIGSRFSQRSSGILRASELLNLLQEKIALLPGGRSRIGGPLLCFPSTSRTDDLRPESLFRLVKYLFYLPDEKVRNLGFVVIVDMRSGRTWNNVKPILKVIEECIGRLVSMTYLIKPDKLLEKHKTQMAIGKFSFEIQMVSVETLFREVDPSQLTVEFEGTLPYHHTEWIKIRCRLEDFFLSAHEMSDKLSQLYRLVDRRPSPESVGEARQGMEEHRSLRDKIINAPISDLESEATFLATWLKYGLAAATNNSSSQAPSTSAASTSFLPTSWVSMNPDFQQLVPQLRETVDRLYQFRGHVKLKWDIGQSRLEQLHQLCLFTDDASRMASWLTRQRRVFLTDHLDIGLTASSAADLYAEHRQFLVTCTSAPEQVSRLNAVAEMLAESGHFASQQLVKQASQLKHEWKSFTAALEDRSRVLQLSASFHTRAESFLANCPHHETDLASPQPIEGSGTVADLNQSLDRLSLWAWFKRLEGVHGEQKRRLTARLALVMFKEDVGHVLAWLTDHGEPFLRRQTSVGRSSARAAQLYNAHMQFEQVGANTLTNADKLIAAADEMASQADHPDELRQEARELQRRITAFTKAVDFRRESLDMSCGFYTLTKEVLAWLNACRTSHNPCEQLPGSIEGVDDEVARFRRDRASLDSAVARVEDESRALASRITANEEASHVKSISAQISSEHSSLSHLLNERAARLDLCLQLRLFEADVLATTESLSSSILVHLTQPVASSPASSGGRQSWWKWSDDPRQAPDLVSLDEMVQACSSLLPSAEEVLAKGGELARAFDSVGVNFPAASNGSSCGETAYERVHRLITELAESVAVVDELNERVSTELDWRRLHLQSQQVLQWIGQCEDILHQGALFPANLAEAEQLQADHERFHPVLNDAHPQAAQCAARATFLFQQHQQQTSSTIVDQQQTNVDLHQADYKAVAEVVANRWQKLVYAAEERHKLLIAATNWYKTSDQVTAVLSSLEKEYQREEDWCQNDKACNDPSTYLNQVSSRHAEQKESFLKACILARRTSDLFSKYLHRQDSSTTTTSRADIEGKIHNAVKEVMSKEKAVLEVWAIRKRRLDECIYFVNIKKQIEALLDRVHEQTQRNRSQLAQSSCCPITTSLVQEVQRACDSLSALVSTPLAPAHTTRLGQLLCQLQATLPDSNGIQMRRHRESVSRHQPPVVIESVVVESDRLVGSNRGSIFTCSLSLSDYYTTSPSHPHEHRTSAVSITTTSSSSTQDVDATLSPAQHKLNKRRQNVLRELVLTEKAYVKDLGQCLDVYLKALHDPPANIKVPPNLASQEQAIFSNLSQIHAFHRDLFEPELIKYTQEGGDFLPEDVGHCFVARNQKLADLYIPYCVSNKYSSKVLIEHGQSFFKDIKGIVKENTRESSSCVDGRVFGDMCNDCTLWRSLFHDILAPTTPTHQSPVTNTQLLHDPIEPINSFLIKPVQRITKYQMLLRELRDCCDAASSGELVEGLEAMLSVPKRANDALYLGLLTGLPDDLSLLSTLGDVILQDQFTVWEPKQLIKKSHERRIFLFDSCLVLTKKFPKHASEFKAKYIYKSRLVMAGCNITEHIEGDQCKFALWTGRLPSTVSEYRMIFKAPSLDVKQTWVRALREVMRERMFSMKSLYQHQVSESNKSDDQSSNTRSSTISSSSGGLPFDNIQILHTYFILENYEAASSNEVSVTAHKMVQLLHRSSQPQSTLDPSQYDPDAADGEWALVRIVDSAAASTTGPSSPLIKEGFIPSRLLGAPCGGSEAADKRHSSHGRRRISGRNKWTSSVNGAARRPSSQPQAKRTSKTGASEQIRVTSEPMPLPPRRQSSVMTADTSSSAALDNVSEESVDVELPPPMTELPVVSSLLSPAASTKMDEDASDDPFFVGSSTTKPSYRDEADESSVNESNEYRPVPFGRLEGDCRRGLGRVPTLVGLPNPNALASLGNLLLHGSLSVAIKLVPTDSPQDDSHLLLSSDLHFLHRHLLLYDSVLVIADGAVEADDAKPPIKCQFRHALPIGQLSIIENLALLDNASSSCSPQQLLWFCLSERRKRPQQQSSSNALASSSLCYVVAPATTDVRARWLTQLSALVSEARRLSQVIVDTSSAGNSLKRGSGCGPGFFLHEPSLFGLVKPSDRQPNPSGDRSAANELANLHLKDSS